MPSHTRQITKTRVSIQTAFAELVFSRRYAEIQMTEVAARANIGRSTLYTHYKDKDAILLDNMSDLITDLAASIAGSRAEKKIQDALSHIWSHRDRGRVVLFGTTGRKLENALVTCLLKTLLTEASHHELNVSPIFVANQIAASLFATLRTWLSGEASGSTPVLARHMCMSSAALVAAAK